MRRAKGRGPFAPLSGPASLLSFRELCAGAAFIPLRMLRQEEAVSLTRLLEFCPSHGVNHDCESFLFVATYSSISQVRREGGPAVRCISEYYLNTILSLTLDYSILFYSGFL